MFIFFFVFFTYTVILLLFIYIFPWLIAQMTYPSSKRLDPFRLHRSEQVNATQLQRDPAAGRAQAFD